MNDDATLTPAEPIQPPPPPTLRKIFFGKDGLRAGWSLLIFLAMLAALIAGANFIGHKIHPPPPRTANQEEVPVVLVVLGDGVIFFGTLLVTRIMSKIERRPNSVYGLGGSRKLPLFLAGLAWGVTFLSLLVLTLWKCGLLVFDSRLLSGGAILRYGAICLLGFFLVGLAEEYLTRGYLQYTLTRGLAGFYRWAFKTRHATALGFWTAAIVFSILFGLGHSRNPGESPIGLLSAGLVGLVFCFSLWRTGSLWWAVGFHTSWDWAQSFLYGVPDSGTLIQHRFLATQPVGKPILSGGATGPEGSIFILAILGLISLVILLTLRRVSYGAAPAPSA